MTTDVTVDVHLAPDAAARALEADVRAGLTRHPKTLPPKWFYDDRGSELFDEITRLPEYYPHPHGARDPASSTRARSPSSPRPTRSSSSARARRRRPASSSTRSRDAGTLDRFVPFDVSEQTLRDAAARGRARVRRRARARGRRRLRAPPRAAPRRRDAARRVPRQHHRQPRARAERAVPRRRRRHPRTRRRAAARHRPRQGRRPARRRLRRRRRRDRRVQPQRAAGARTASSSADFDPDAFEHVARFDTDAEWIEMRPALDPGADRRDRRSRP